MLQPSFSEVGVEGNRRVNKVFRTTATGDYYSDKLAIPPVATKEPSPDEEER